MGLDRAKGDAEFRADLLVDQSGNHQQEDFEFTWLEVRQSACDFPTSRLRCWQAMADRVSACATAESSSSSLNGFDKKIDCRAFHHTNSHWYISVPGDEGDFFGSTILRELALEGQAIESWQVHVEQKARRAGIRNPREILAGADEDLDSVVLRRQ
jgi:hypothetical protein